MVTGLNHKIPHILPTQLCSKSPLKEVLPPLDFQGQLKVFFPIKLAVQGTRLKILSLSPTLSNQL